MKNAAIVLALIALPTATAQARWKAEYADASPVVRDWYESRVLTEAAQKRFPFKSCCAHSDVVKTKFKTTTGDEWWWLDGATWRQVPADIIHWDQHAPDGQPVMFAVGGLPVCFFPPDGGI